MKIAVCNDNQDELCQIAEYVEKCCEKFFLPAKIVRFSTANELLANILNNRFDILFVCLNKIDGMETVIKAHELCPKAELVWISDSADYALQAYRLQCNHYLMKPVTQENISEALKRCKLYTKTRFGALGHIFYPQK